MPEAERMSEERLAHLRGSRNPSCDEDAEMMGEFLRLRASESRLRAELAEERGKRERMEAALLLTLEEAQQHPLCMEIDATDAEINREGGDAAFVTVIAQRCHSALATIQEPRP